MGFPDGTRHDDMIDAVGLAAKRLAKLGHFTPQPNQPDPNHAFNQYLAREDKDDQGRRMSNMQLGPMFEDREQPKILSIIRNRI